MRIPGWLVLVALAGAVLVGRCSAPERTRVELRVDTVAVAAPWLMAQIDSLELQADGLRDRLAGRREVEPEVIYVAEETIPAPEACQLTVRIDGGRLAVSPLIRVPETGEYRARLLDGLDVTRCDDGLSVAPDGTTVCDVPRFGHLALVGSGGLLNTEPWGWLGLEWTPYWRSAWRATAGARAWGDGLTWEIGLSRRLVGIW